MNELNKKLEKLDLKDKEIQIYLAILAIGKGTISDVAKKSNIKRTTIYQYIAEILSKGLIYKTVRNKTIYYSPENPEKIIKILENKKRTIETIIPELKSLYSNSFKKPKISFYEGRLEIKKIYSEAVETHKNIYSYFSPQNLFNLLNFEENHEILMKLYENGGKLYNLVEKSDKSFERLKIKKYDKFVKSKLLPSDFKFATDQLIVGDKLILISFINLMAVIIEDKAIAGLQKNIFKYIWKTIK